MRRCLTCPAVFNTLSTIPSPEMWHNVSSENAHTSISPLCSADTKELSNAKNEVAKPALTEGTELDLARHVVTGNQLDVAQRVLLTSIFFVR